MLDLLYAIIMALLAMRIYSIYTRDRVEIRRGRVFHRGERGYWLYLMMFVFFAMLVSYFYFFQ